MLSNMLENFTINIAEVIYQDFTSALTPTTSAWCYGYLWNAYIVAALGDLSKYKMFASNPNRYSIGHICVEDKFGVVDDFTWKFEIQKTKNYRGHFFDGQPEPGNIVPQFPTPIDTNTYGFYPISTNSANQIESEIRGTKISVFNPNAIECVLIVNYYATFVFDASTIAASAPLQVLGLFP